MTTETLVNVLQEHWTPYFGRPRIIRVDPEGAMRSREFEKWGATEGIEILPTPGGDHSQQGLVESTVGILRTGADKMLQDRPDFTVLEAARKMCTAHYTLERVRGFSPFQWALGRQPTAEGNLHRDNDDNNIVLIENS